MNTVNRWNKKVSWRARWVMVLFVVVAMLATNGAPSGMAQQAGQPRFKSAAEAIQALFQAVQSGNEQTIANILGAPTDLTSSQDEGQDKVDRELFVQKYQEMHRLVPEADGSVNLYIGAENWPFPIPLVEKDGAWFFDADAGRNEVLFRRIGENELAAIATCHEFVAAEKQYRAKADTPNLENSSPASLVAKAATGATGGDPVLLQGYYFRVVRTRPKRPGEFVLIAYPAEYRSSGVMTFVVTEKGIVYEKDLGPNTSALANAIATFHKDAMWNTADE
jgi:Protein of unknown function (DUF2950)